MPSPDEKTLKAKRKTSGSSPSITLPSGSIDTHMHIFSPLFATDKTMAQPSDNAGLSMYKELQNWLGLERTVIVQANAHQKDNSCLLNALEKAGSTARAVACITPDMSEQELITLDKKGVRGARIMEFGGAVRINDLLAVNRLIQPLNWSPIIQFNGSEIASYFQLLEKIKGNYVIDHAGKFLSPTTTSNQSFKSLLKLIDKGNCYIKLAGCYEISQAGYPYYQDIADLSKALIKHAPERVIWGSNWPHILSKPENTPDDAQLLDTVTSWIPDTRTLEKIFVENPAKLYGFN